MSVAQRVRGVRVLKAVSSSVRLQILNLLFDKGSLSYTEIMNSLKMIPGRDAGRFVYHLKFLLKADLVEVDVDSKKYCLTDLGKTVLEVADKIQKRTTKSKRLLIRTSRPALEDFDANKIANSLITEAKMPEELAQKVAKEAENRLLRSKTRYLTAPLVREFVNAILIEKGLEEYRHRLTRLGLPVYDVTNLIEAKTNWHKTASLHERAGAVVFEEYMLLNVFPRDIGDAHLSGSLHIKNLSSWTLRPSEAIHDLRFFFQNGLDLEKMNVHKFSHPPPKNLRSALCTLLNVLHCSQREIAETQTFAYFNVFLAPFVSGMGPHEIKEAIQLFILSGSQREEFSLDLELKIPDFMKEKPVFRPDRKQAGKYGDFAEESQMLASILVEVLTEVSASKPLDNPKLIIKLRPELFLDKTAEELLLKLHNLALKRGLPYFANLSQKNLEASIFSHSGLRLNADNEGDWETDTLRTGCLGCVTVNVPRIAYESEGNELKFHEGLKEKLEMAARAIQIKDRALKQRGEHLLPFLTQSVDGDRYFRLENCLRIINLVGLKEASEAFCKSSICNEKTSTFAAEILQSALDCISKIGKRRKLFFLASLPDFEGSERLARLDIEKYGVAKVHFSGTRENPFYSTVNKVTLRKGEFTEELLRLHRFYGKVDVGNLTVIELEEFGGDAEELMLTSKHILENKSPQFFTYNRKLTYCVRCKKSLYGLQHKCPSCEATSTLTFFEGAI